MTGNTTHAQRSRRTSTPAGQIRRGDVVMWGGRPTTITATTDINPRDVRLTNNHGEVLDVAKSGPIIRVATAARLRVA